MSKLRGAVPLAVVALTVGCADDPHTARSARGLAGDGVVISAVYGGGGLSGASLRNDFVELFNRSNAAVSLSGLSIQYGSATGNFGNSALQILALPATATIAPGRYYLIQLNSGGANGSSLPTPDLTGTIDFANANGKVALARVTTGLGCGTSTNRCPTTNIVDMVGYGTAADYEGTAAAAALNATRAAVRRGAGCIDTDDNAADFDTTVTPVATPRNGATPASPCATSVDAGLEDTGTVELDAAVVIEDASAPDASAEDAAIGFDAELTDTGTITDAGLADTGTVADAGLSDSGVAEDASELDASVPDLDASEPAFDAEIAPDAAAELDAGTPPEDAAIVLDAAAPDAEPVDAGFADAHVPDAAAPDASAPDAAAPDAGWSPTMGDGLVISQVYGGGGNTNAVYTNDFVELFNRSNVAVSLNGLSIQYGSASGNFANPSPSGPGSGLTVLPDVMVQPGQYYLVRMASNGSVGMPIATADFDGISNLSSSSGKVALARINTTLGCGATPCDRTNIVDLVGYGSPTDYEGTAAAPALNSTQAAFRAGNGCTDTNDNAADFTASTPSPRDSTLPAINCAAQPTDAGVADATTPSDSGVRDAGGRDAGSTDATTPDSGRADATTQDATTPPADATVNADATTSNDAATSPDASEALDATAATDASAALDATTARDAGSSTSRTDDGCSCTATETAPTSSALGGLLVLGLGLVMTRRRR